MQIKATNKYSLICLLLCLLFLTSYIIVLNTNSIISLNFNIFDIFSGNGGSEHASMNDSTNAGHDDYMAVVNTAWESSRFSIQQLHLPGTKTSFRTLAAIISVQTACLIYYTRLSDRICTQFNSIGITIFLHKRTE
ncbi:MAG TPA: hypothetical protein VN370_00035 [Desulfitobacteriaceae bacterium]|nr:hypothetical protein [Desulfitobacteriaceae bacterium]